MASGKAPPKSGTITGGVSAPVEVRWDSWGIPHIRAQTRPDLFFALGYVTAQECLWRLDYLRRTARGELAAILGREALESDRTVRTVGIGKHADALARELPSGQAEVLDAYAAGINRWIDEAIDSRRLPLEFDWLDYQPARWTPADSIACWKYRWWGLTGRLQNIAIGEAALRHLPSSLNAAFMATELGGETIVPGDGAGSAGGAAGLPGGADDGEGSNNWVVAGSRTTTGHPVLCSDPHNAFEQPGQWFEAQLSLADGSLDFAGATYAGWPAVYMGRNRHVAWGFTNHVASARDLYVETVDPARPGRYLEHGEWRAFETEQGTIEVAGEAPVTHEVRRTVRGPLVDHVLPALGGESTPISLRWTGVEAGTGLDAILGLNAARTVDEALDALAMWPCPILNAHVADDRGRIAYHAVGFVPRRVEATRRYRRAGAPDDAWQGFLRFDELPHLVDPPRGWLASANQSPWPADPAGVSYLAGGAWADGYRMRRIRLRITAQPKHTPAALGAIQADVVSLRAAELAPAVVRLGENSPDGTVRRAAELLRGWDGAYTAESLAATVWTAFWEQWISTVAAARFPERVVSLVSGQAGAVARRLLLGDDTSPPWFARGDVAAHVADALSGAVRWLESRVGPDESGWAWSALHTVTWEHSLSHHGPAEQRTRAAETFDLGPFPTTGGPTVRAAGFSTARPFHVTGGATYRLIADLSPDGGIVSTTTTGQSGHPDSPHYADQARLWLNDEYHPLPMDDFEPEGVMHVVPSANRQFQVTVTD
ncbi:MAG: penicillin acylase family protein [Chloroflexi bacterium]|nr:penicillin acylase family protein [Chloroflexota bacterium]